jgi:transglutaminase-like putative cysteine protease
MKYSIRHETHYAYSQPVVLCHNEARLIPRATPRQVCTRSEITVMPPAAVRSEREDIFGNRVLYFAIQEGHGELVVTANSEVEITQAPVAYDPSTSPPWEQALEQLRTATTAEDREARQFVLDSPCAAASADLRQFAAPSFPAGRPILAAVHDLSTRIHREFTFDPQSTTVTTALSEVLANRGGVCQDFAHLAIGCLRSYGLPARYMSGYLETLPPPGGERLQGADASHAWFAVYVAGMGWFELDPTNDQIPGERYVTTAWGRDFSDVTPLKGVIFGGGTHTLDVGVDMMRHD